MNDPYSVLNVSPDASDEEVKKAYREMARKYHPDNYHDNPLADLAQEKMKEINEAYDTLQKQRSGAQSRSGYGGSYSGGYAGGYQRDYSASGSGEFRQVRMAIQRNDLNMAERMLNQIATRNGEWFFLRGSICVRRGWLDEAHRSYKTACSMSPDNMEYRAALERLENTQGYRPQGFEVVTSDCGGSGMCRNVLCGYCLCNLCLGGGMFC